jgi:hypothetical protein
MAVSYLYCPACRATFREGVIYESRQACPRCGASLDGRPRRLGRLRRALRRNQLVQGPDWEAITGSQYTRRRVSPGGLEDRGDTPSQS